MKKEDMRGIWDYYLTLEEDILNTARYIEPLGQENVHSFEFAKILILACTEVESLFKLICQEIEGKSVRADIAEYKRVILSKYPRIIETRVVVARLNGSSIYPFAEWATGPLTWWDAYQCVKHSRSDHFADATYINAVTALSALYILIFYLSKATGYQFHDTESKYIDSLYSHTQPVLGPREYLPDFIPPTNQM